MCMNAKAYEHTRYFTEECGQRIAGTEAVLKASDYIISYFKGKGIPTEIHEFQVPVCEVEHSVLKAKTDGEWSELEHTPALFSKETPVGGMTLPFIYAEDGSIANLKEKDVRGKAVLICRDVYMVYPDISMYKRLHEYGAAAVIYTTNDGHWDVPYVYANFETMNEEFTIPTAVIHYKTAMQLLAKGTDEIFIDVKFNIRKGMTRNTIGVIEGTEKKEENIIICGHLDSAVSSTGATDDVAAVAMIMELARHYQNLAASGKRPKRTLRFIAWSGHECGLHGSKYYLLEHPEVFHNTKFVLNYDVVGNVLCNYSMWGAMQPEVEENLCQILSKLELDWPLQLGPMVVDTLNFAVREIPQITLTGGFYGWNHTKYDSLELISQQAFEYPIQFSKGVIDWAVETETIVQGYPEPIMEGMKATGAMYGWGLF